MRIIADRDIPQVESAFSEYGDVELVSGRSVTAEQLRDAEILIVRSVTRVDQDLLKYSKVGYVGTATSGTDHLDKKYLQDSGIVYFDAAGCNARAVAEYVAACSFLHGQPGSVERDISVGIVGFGHVGKRVYAMLSALGLDCVVNDPLIEQEPHDVEFVPLEHALSCDIVTLHVPYTQHGEFPTKGLIDRAQLAQARPDALLINAARGGVIDEQSLVTWLTSHPAGHAAIDCWYGEPTVDLALLDRAAIATPHIAGHTNEARLRATTMLVEQLANKLEINQQWTPQPVAPIELGLQSHTAGESLDLLGEAVLRCCDPRVSTKLMRKTAGLSRSRRATEFDELRRKAGSRCEFSSHRVACDGWQLDTVRGLRELGFATTMNGNPHE